VTGYSTESWGDFFLAAAGAAAVLTGLIFVAVSVNIRPVLEADERSGGNFLTGRALEALVALLNVLVISVVGLTPTIPDGVLAAVILVVAAESAISPVNALRAGRNQLSVRGADLLRMVTAFTLTAGLAVAGITLAAHHGGGLFWLPAVFVMAVFIAAINSWVLLVEVLR
jgi:hypothetical protein